MPKQLTERQAWLFLARKWKRVRCPRAHLPRIHIGQARAVTLCAALLHLVGYGRISQEQFSKMRSPIVEYTVLNPEHYPFAWPLTRDGAKSRAAFCLAQASKIKKTKPKKGKSHA